MQESNYSMRLGIQLWYFSYDLLSKSPPKYFRVGWSRLLIYQKDVL